MSIASQFPVVSPAQSGSALRALALTPGQVIEGRVLGAGQGGATLVQIGRQPMALSLPGGATPGSILTLSVQQTEGQLRLALVSSRPPPTTPAPQAPATSVEIAQRPVVQGPITYSPPSLTPSGGTTSPVIAAPITAQPTPSAPPPAAQPAIGQPMATQPIAPGIQQRLGSTPYGMPPMSGAQQTAAPAAQPGPQASLLALMVQQSLPVQGSIGAVTSLLVAVAGKTALPEPVLKAAQQILGNQLDGAGKLDGATLKAAIRNSGIFQEAQLGQGAPGVAATDTKSSLMAMRQGLGQWLGNQAQIAPATQIPPPLKHVLPRARLPEASPDELPEDGEALGKLLLERTEGALARVRLHQHASLPDGQKASDTQWSLDLPVLVGQQQSVLQLQIHHEVSSSDTRSEDRGWQVQFAINLPALGEVGAQISLRGQTTGILLWAENHETAKVFSETIEELRTTLEAAGLYPGALVVRSGAPAEDPTDPRRGHSVDARG